MDEAWRRNQAAKYNLHHHSRTLPELGSGQKVWITTEEVPGTVLSVTGLPWRDDGLE